MSKGLGSKTVLSLFLVGALGVGALALYVKTDPNAARVLFPPVTKTSDTTDDSVTVHRHRARPSVDDSQSQSDDSTAVYLPEVRGEHAALARDKTDVPGGKDPKAFVAEKTLKAIGLDGVKVLNVDVRNGVAAINFNDQIDAGMGSTQEAQFLDALEVGFGQFPDVRRIQIEKEGESLDSLGHIDLSGPLEVVRPGADQQAGNP